MSARSDGASGFWTRLRRSISTSKACWSDGSLSVWSGPSTPASTARAMDSGWRRIVESARCVP